MRHCPKCNSALGQDMETGALTCLRPCGWSDLSPLYERLESIKEQMDHSQRKLSEVSGSFAEAYWKEEYERLSKEHREL